MKLTKEQQKRDRYLRRKYGIGVADYEALLKKQNYSCAICKKHHSKFKKRLAVDHDHKSLETRGLLCFYCNRRFVGQHTKETVVKLVEYLLPNMRLVAK